MSNLEQAARLALDALQLHGEQYPHMVKGYCLDAITELESALKQQAEPVVESVVEPVVEPVSRSQAMRDAGYIARDTRLTCDECGGKFTAQMLPIHKCKQQAEPVVEPDASGNPSY